MVGVGVATSRLRASSLLLPLLVVVVLVAAPQVECSGLCFRLDGLRLLGRLAEELRLSGPQLQGGGGDGGGGGGGGWGLRLWLHLLPEAAPASSPPDDDLPVARVGRTRISLDPNRNVLEVEGFPSELEVSLRDDSPLINAVDTGKPVPMKEVPIERNTILKDLQLMEDTNHLPGHVVLSVNPWAPQAAAVLPQFLVIVRTRSGLSCEVELPSTVEGARRLLDHLSQLEARHAVTEVVVVSSESLPNTVRKCEELVRDAAPAPLPLLISPASVVAAWDVEGGWLRLGPRLRALLPPPPPPATLWGYLRPPQPPPVQLRACLPHPGLQEASMPAYWKKVFAIITGALSQRLTVSDGSADEQTREQDPPTGTSLADRLPSLFHRRARRSYMKYHEDTFVKKTEVQKVYEGPPPGLSPLYGNNRRPVPQNQETVPSVNVQEAEQTQAHNNYKLPLPTDIIFDNTHVQVTQMPPNWPFHPGASPPPRYVWRENIWEEVVYENNKWEIVTPSRPLNPPSHTQERPKPLCVLINGKWLFLTSPNILWDETTNSFHPPQKLLQYQPNSTPTYAWLNDKWVEIANTNKQWTVAPAGRGNKKPPVSQNKDEICLAWDGRNWVLCKLSDLFAMNNRPPQHGSNLPWRPQGPHNGGFNWPSGKVVKPTGKYPAPPPKESYNLQGAPPGRPNFGNQPSLGSHNQNGYPSGHTNSESYCPPDGSNSSPTTGQLHFSLPFGSYGQKGTPQGRPGKNCHSVASHKNKWNISQGKGNQRGTQSWGQGSGRPGSLGTGKQLTGLNFGLPYGSYKM